MAPLSRESVVPLGCDLTARELAALGHTVRLMAAQFVIPYRKRGKNDANDGMRSINPTLPAVISVR